MQFKFCDYYKMEFCRLQQKYYQQMIVENM